MTIVPLTQNDIAQPIDWKDAKFATMLDDLQGHILKHHGRDHTNHLFLRFDGPADATKTAIRAIGNLVLTALEQLQQAEDHKALGTDGGPAILFYLAASGYQKLGLNPPVDQAFRDGMRHRPGLDDPPDEMWEEHFRDPADALLIVADTSDTTTTQVEGSLLPVLQVANITILGRDVGRALKDAQNVGHEQFGYTDGISQPLMLEAEVNDAAATIGTDQWHPGFGPGEVALVADPHGVTDASFGSYLVYRKLEQNVRKFKQAEQDLADALLLAGIDRERAGAMVVGRFENGTPIAPLKSDSPQDLTNNFAYPAIDPGGLRCPFQGHIRKTNPRGDTGSAATERARLMPRRGIPYGERAGDEWQNDDIASKPTEGVGLIFMAFNQDVARQFEFTQQSWANNADFMFGRAPRPGLDPLIGEGLRVDQTWRAEWSDPASPTAVFSFPECVTLRGGEYFFAPSVGFLKTIN